MSYHHDPELEFLRDPELLEIANLLQSRSQPKPPLDPSFQSSLRRDLRRQQWEMLQTGLPWWRRLTSGPGLAWSFSAVGVVMIAAAVLFAIHPPGASNELVVSSPLNNMRDVALVQPMKIQFAQSMDHQSVESALTIEPATQVTYTWDGNTLVVQPQAGQLAPNTQYKLTLGSTATSARGAQLGKPTTITFITGPSAAPSPNPSPTPQPAGIALGTAVQLGPALGGVAPAWSPDGSTIYFAGPDDSLQSIASAGGTPKALGAQAVSGIAVSPDGTTLASMSSSSVTWAPISGHGLAGAAEEANPLAIAWSGSKLLVASGPGVSEGKLTPGPTGAGLLAHFTAGAQQATFSPDGKRVLYLDSTGKVHLVEIGGDKDTTWQTSTTGLPVWSQDGSQVAFMTLQGIQTAAPDGTGAAVLASLDQLGVESADGVSLVWTGGAVVAATPAGLTGIDATLRSPAQLATGSFSAPSASPDRQSIAYVENGTLYVAPIQRPGMSDKLQTQAKTVLQSFMDARKAGDSTSAAKFLDASGQQAYQKAALVFSGEPHLARWFPVFLQVHPDGTATAIVRLVLADPKKVEVAQLDETITMLGGADGSVLVHDVAATSSRPVDSGPEVVDMEVSGHQLTIQFDSDLDPGSLSAISAADQAGGPISVTPTYSKRTVTIDLSSLSPGTLLQLSITPSLKDVQGRGAAQAIVIPVRVPAAS